MFNRMLAAVKDWRPAFKQIAADFYKVEKQQFETQGSRKSAWEALSPKYALYKNRHFPGKKILERTGELKKSLTTASGVDSVYVETYQELRVGAESKVGSWHQHGVPEDVGSRMPARRPMDLTPKDKSRWVKYMHEFMAHAARKQG